MFNKGMATALAVVSIVFLESLGPDTNLKSRSRTLTDEARTRELVPGKLIVLMPARSQK
jgi:hypothetical protein